MKRTVIVAIIVGLFAFVGIPAASAAPRSHAAECGEGFGYNKFQVNDTDGTVDHTQTEVSDPPGLVIDLFFTDNPATLDAWEYTYDNNTLDDADTSNDWLIFQIVLKGGKGTSVIQDPPQDGTFSAPLHISHITFCLQTPADLHLSKSSGAPVEEGQTTTFTIEYSNSGSGPARTATITDQIPENTEFVSCTNSCTVTGDTVTWQVGPVPPGGSGRVTLTVRVLDAPDNCQICNVAVISGPEDLGGPETSNVACVTVIPVPDPEGANARGSATGLSVDLTNLPAGLPPLDITISQAASSQSGPGSTSDNDQFLRVDVPTAELLGIPPGGIVTAEVLTTTSSSSVSESSVDSIHTSTSEVLGLNVLRGVLTSSTLRAVASTKASESGSSFSSAGSTFENLLIDADGPNGPMEPVLYTDVLPGTTVDLSDLVFGEGSYIALYERDGSTSSTEDTFSSDLTVNLIHVFVTDLLPLVDGNQTLEIIVSQAVAHSDFPAIQVCEPAPPQTVSGHAFIVSERTSPSLVPVLEGLSRIPVTGGQDHQHLDHVRLPEDGSIIDVSAAETDSCGFPGTNDCSGFTASSFSEASGVCVLANPEGCTVGATFIRSQSNSASGPAGSNDAGTQLVGLTVFGTDVCALIEGLEPTDCTPEPNTVIPLDADGAGPLPSFGVLILNEQFCDGDGQLESNCETTSGSSGLTVRAIHLIVTSPTNPLGVAAGAEVIVAEAHSDVSS